MYGHVHRTSCVLRSVIPNIYPLSGLIVCVYCLVRLHLVSTTLFLIFGSLIVVQLLLLAPLWLDLRVYALCCSSAIRSCSVCDTCLLL